MNCNVLHVLHCIVFRINSFHFNQPPSEPIRLNLHFLYLHFCIRSVKIYISIRRLLPNQFEGKHAFSGLIPIVGVYESSMCTNRRCVRTNAISRHSSTGQLVYLEKCMQSIIEKEQAVSRVPRS